MDSSSTTKTWKLSCNFLRSGLLYTLEGQACTELLSCSAEALTAFSVTCMALKINYKCLWSDFTVVLSRPAMYWLNLSHANTIAKHSFSICTCCLPAFLVAHSALRLLLTLLHSHHTECFNNFIGTYCPKGVGYESSLLHVDHNIQDRMFNNQVPDFLECFGVLIGPNDFCF